MFTNKFIQTLCLLCLGTFLSCGGSETREEQRIAATEMVATQKSSSDTTTLEDNLTQNSNQPQPSTSEKYEVDAQPKPKGEVKPTSMASTPNKKETQTPPVDAPKTTVTTTRGSNSTKTVTNEPTTPPKPKSVEPKSEPKNTEGTNKKVPEEQQPKPKDSGLQQWAKSLSSEWKKTLKLEDSFTDKEIEQALAIHILEIDGKEVGSWSKLCTFSSEREVWKKLTHLEHIQFKNCRIDRGFDVLNGKQVKFIDFDKCNFWANNWESLGDVKTLENISFENGAESMNFSRWEWQSVFDFPNLHSLHFEDVPQNEQNIKSLQKFAENRKNLGVLYNGKPLPQKEEIKIPPYAFTPQAWRETLAKNNYSESQVPTLSKLKITKNEYRQLAASSPKAINMVWQKMTNLKILTFESCEMDFAFLNNQDFSKIPNLTISFESCGFTKIKDSEWTAFAKKNPNVKKITLVNGNLSSSARQAIQNGNFSCEVK